MNKSSKKIMRFKFFFVFTKLRLQCQKDYNSESKIVLRQSSKRGSLAFENQY